MKKLAVVCLAMLIAVAFCVSGTVAFAQEESDLDYQNHEIYRFVEEFLANCSSRYGAEQELIAVTYLKDKFDEALLDVGAVSEIVPFGTDDNAGYNLVAQLRSASATAKTVVVGAHYDATGVGANDNACGVAALYFAMKGLAGSASSLPFNVTFVAFGGEERGLLGSQNFVASLSEAQKQDVLIAFDIDVIVNGDNLYVFCENKHTALADFVLQNAASGCNLKEKPYAKGIYSAFDVYGFGYYEAIQGSDSSSFRLEGIPTALFFSGNYPLWDYVESIDQNKNNMNTNADTLENLNVNNGSGIVERIETVFQTICNIVLDENFLAVAENARNELINNDVWYNSLWPKLVLCGVLVVLAVLAGMYYRKLEKISLMNPTEVKNTKVFGTPDVEDIFSFEDKTNDQIDDIFQLKK